jgi:hypothetical protein
VQWGRISCVLLQAALPAATVACGFSPISHRIKVGEEPYFVFVGEGVDGHTDLFTALPGGGTVYQLTFTPVPEALPRLAPGGGLVAFVRGDDTLPATLRHVVVMNLFDGNEGRADLDNGAGPVEALAWAGDGKALYARAGGVEWRIAVPPASAPPLRVTGAAVDSALEVWLGNPPFARAISCPGGGVCVIGSRGDTATLADEGHDPMRWGGDSVAWIEGADVVVRPLGPGRARRIALDQPPGHMRQGSYADMGHP